MTMFGSRKKYFNANPNEEQEWRFTTAWGLLENAEGHVVVRNNRGRVLAEFWGL